ncbi:MAG: porin [Burkholderiales bacterium]
MRRDQSAKKLALAAAMAACSLNAHAGATVSFGEDKSISVGFGLRFSGSSVEDAAPNKKNYSSDFSLDSARIFLGGSLNKYISGFFNTEKDGDTIKVLDAVVKFTIAPELNVWVGRVLPPGDRANLAGGYYSLGGGYWAGVASRYGYNGGIFRGRDDGLVVWGNVADGKLGYSFGVFEGHTFGIGSLTQSQAKSAGTSSKDNLMYAARLQYDFWDAEPGFYGTGNYLGAKDILAIGVAGQYQKDGVLTAGGKGDYYYYNVDFLLEKKIKGSGAVSFEAAVYDYGTGKLIKSEAGQAYSAGAGYVFEQPVGWGRVQPFVRIQRFNANDDVNTKAYDVGVLYIIDGYNAQISATYRKTKASGGLSPKVDNDAFTAAMQFQF